MTSSSARTAPSWCRARSSCLSRASTRSSCSRTFRAGRARTSASSCRREALRARAAGEEVDDLLQAGQGRGVGVASCPSWMRSARRRPRARPGVVGGAGARRPTPAAAGRAGRVVARARAGGGGGGGAGGEVPGGGGWGGRAGRAPGRRGGGSGGGGQENVSRDLPQRLPGPARGGGRDPPLGDAGAL